MATKTRAKTKRKKTTIRKTARLRKTVRKTKAIRKEAAKKAPPPESLEVYHAPVTEVRPNDDFGLKVIEHAREHDIVCKVRS